MGLQHAPLLVFIIPVTGILFTTTYYVLLSRAQNNTDSQAINKRKVQNANDHIYCETSSINSLSVFVTKIKTSVFH
jgi:hypothetical protein